MNPNQDRVSPSVQAGGGREETAAGGAGRETALPVAAPSTNSSQGQVEAFAEKGLLEKAVPVGSVVLLRHVTAGLRRAFLRSTSEQSEGVKKATYEIADELGIPRDEMRRLVNGRD